MAGIKRVGLYKILGVLAGGNKGRFVLPYNVSRKETWGVLDAQSDSSLILEKPFKTKVGAFFAKVLHKIISWGYNFTHWIKNKFKK